MGKENDYGVVSDGHGFQDSPDCERISGGINSKGPYAVAIGRQANMLQWGFYAAPDRMTDSARRAFLNTLVYMQRFDGSRPLVEKRSRSRAWLVQYLGWVREMTSSSEERNESFLKHCLEQFPSQLVEKVGPDAEALGAWLEEHREYLRRDEDRHFVVDPDLLAIGVSNRQPAFLDWLQQSLRTDPTDARALRLAERYLGEHGSDAPTALAWIEAHRPRLFFSDTGGFRWVVDTRRSAAGTTEARGSTADRR